jgi:endo-1,4-beta-xylanase
VLRLGSLLCLTSVLAVGPLAPGSASGRAGAAPAPGLRDLAAPLGLRIGSAIADDQVLLDPTYAATLARELDMGVSENHMKWQFVHPAPTTYDFNGADAQVAFAEAHGMAYRGHNLAWSRQNPPWLTGPFTRDQRIQQLRDHITTVVGHYAGRVAQWDVVNEAFDGLQDPAHDPWAATIGFPEYLDIAFRTAHTADPAAKLFYNDYNLESANPKFDQVVDLVAGMKARGVPIDGIGFESHLGARSCNASCTNATLKNMLRAHALGLEVAITELDVALPLPATPQALEQQASVYRSMLEACLLAPNCHTFMTWGFTDKYSWIPSFIPGYGAALPFDEDYQPKPAYAAMVATLTSPPKAPSCDVYPDRAAAQKAFASGVLGAPLLDPDGNGVACETVSYPVASTTAPTTVAPARAPEGLPTPVAPRAAPVVVAPALTG